MKILIFANQLYLGGAERVASLISNGLNSRNHKVVIAADITNYPITYHLDNGVKLIDLSHVNKSGFFNKLKRILERISKRRTIIKKEDPDVIIAFTHQVFFWTLIANIFLRIPLIASDHTAIDRDMGTFSNLIRGFFYKYADVLTILTEKDKQLLGKKFPNKIVVPNPLTYEVSKVNYNIREKIVLCAGRISYWQVKGFDRIIEIWRKLSSKYPEWKLYIAGPGDNNSIEFLESLINKYHLSSCVTLLGQVDDMKSLYQKVGIFALPSRVEGFPMVLIEAMSQGCPCISFEMNGAVREIIDNGIDGILVDDGDVCAFSRKLDNLMEDYSKRERISKVAPIHISRFSIDNILNIWEKIIVKLLNKS